MSASLVGSEMCIRDRGKGGGKGGGQGGGRRGRRGGGQGQPDGGAQGSQGKGCLLYTSDAADDMQ
eukprot:7173678-Alexandrium_andersonii.AAC.1